MAKNNQSVNARFTGREMEAIAAMLLGENGIDVTPIINDLYPDLEESQKSMFRCKMALMLNGKLPEFQAYEGFRRTGSTTVKKFRVYGESSLLGLLYMECVEVYEYDKDTDIWVPRNDHYDLHDKKAENIDFKVFDTIEEAVEKW